MALDPTFSLSKNGESVELTITTGTYSASANQGGHGTPNPAASAVYYYYSKTFDDTTTTVSAIGLGSTASSATASTSADGWYRIQLKGVDVASAVYNEIISTGTVNTTSNRVSTAGGGATFTGVNVGDIVQIGDEAYPVTAKIGDLYLSSAFIENYSSVSYNIYSSSTASFYSTSEGVVKTYIAPSGYQETTLSEIDAAYTASPKDIWIDYNVREEETTLLQQFVDSPYTENLKLFKKKQRALHNAQKRFDENNLPQAKEDLTYADNISKANQTYKLR